MTDKEIEKLAEIEYPFSDYIYNIAVSRRQEFIKVFKVGLSHNESDGWISVKDRLPESYQPVIVFNGDITDNVAYRDGPFIFHDGGYDRDSYEVKDVTHWMPLPSPPKL